MVDKFDISKDQLTCTRDDLKFHDARRCWRTYCLIDRWSKRDALGQAHEPPAWTAVDDKTFRLVKPFPLTLSAQKPSSSVPFVMPSALQTDPFKNIDTTPGRSNS
jgi:hypothetical protein